MHRSPLHGGVRGRVAGKRDKGRGGAADRYGSSGMVDQQGERLDRLHRVSGGQDLGCPHRGLGVGMAQGPGEPGVELPGVVDGQGGAA